MNAFLNAARHLNPWSNVYGAARTLLALSTLSSLVFSRPDDLFRPLGQELAAVEIGGGINRISLFSLLPGDRLLLAYAIAIGILLLVISGWRPRITGVLHWWVAFSYVISAVTIEGGDQIIANLTLLMLPLTLTDPRRSHWSAAPPLDDRLWGRILAMVAVSALIVIRLQVAGIYFHAAIGKLRVAEWANGTALYYWLMHPKVGTAEWLHPLILPIATNAVGVVVLTWSVLVLEMLLFMALVMDRKYHAPLLVAGVLFHAGIIFAHGLASFFFAMAGALVLYLRPPSEPFSLAALRSWAARAAGLARALAAGIRPRPAEEVPVSAAEPFHPAAPR